MSNYFEKYYTDNFFNVSKTNGFLPIKEPLITLPNTYIKLQNLIDELHVFQEDNKQGILAIPNLIEQKVSELPNYYEQVKLETDVFILQALFRAYTFITSGFTLELSYQEFIKSGNYGKARTVLPENIAIPLVEVSNKLQVYPWLDYHYAYSLGNYVKKNKSGTLDWQNLDMACKFTGTPDEIGFIMVHVYINELTPELVGSVLDYEKTKNIKYLKKCAETMTEINKRRRSMWSASRHERYNDFRIFIMGIKGNDGIFGDGLVYSGCFDNKPQKFRGQTGAQDSIIPMVDIFSGIVDYYPENELTNYLIDLRSYRPVCIQDFFKDLREYYKNGTIFGELVKSNNLEGLVYLLKIIDEVYLFRNGHWQFVQKYIMSNTKYAFATGGTPITTWLINQIEAVLEFERVIIDYVKINIQNKLSNQDMWIKLRDEYNAKKELLMTQVNELQKANYDINLIYTKNAELKLEDSKL
jgi:indoleamine 2,3-dioxygenase